MPASSVARLAVALLLCALTACGTVAQSRQATQTFSFTEGEDVDNLNPVLTNEILVTDLSVLTQGYLITFDARNRLVPSLSLQVPTAANHLISADGRTITYMLRRGVHWQDGYPFTAADVAFSAKTIVDPKVNASSTLGYDQITSVATPDDYTVVVRLKRPYAAFVALFLTPGVGSGILPKHLLQGKEINHAEYNALPVGLGPFKYTRWLRGSSVEMAAYDGWWGGRPKLRSIVYRIIPDASTAISQLSTRELSAFGRVPDEQYLAARGTPHTRTLDFATTAYEHVDFNVQNPILQDRRVRQALAHAIDVKMIVQKVNHGSGILSCSPIPVSSWAYDSATPCFGYDLPAARRLLDAAGWKLHSDGIRYKSDVPLRLTLVSTSGNLSRDETALIMQAAFKDIGVPLQYVRYQANALFANQTGILSMGKYDLSIYAWYWGADPDISNLYSCAQRPPHGQNFSRYCSPQVDALLAQALAHYDRATRRAYYRRVQQIVGTDVPSVVLFQHVDHLTADDRFRHLDPGPFQLLTRPGDISGNY
ncbi:MAG TPA: peptide ABC transporter substrate-binding protein [Candidatus Tumulicola sp.]|jgi:peptide/nickel transport system substrate-binding protein